MLKIIHPHPGMFFPPKEPSVGTLHKHMQTWVFMNVLRPVTLTVNNDHLIWLSKMSHYHGSYYYYQWTVIHGLTM